MPLIACKECNKEISDTAAVCPHCGAPGPKAVASSIPKGDLPEYPGYAKNVEGKKVGGLLAAGIVLMPYIFAWVTLKKGYSSTVRGISFGWMVIALLIIGANETKKDQVIVAPASTPIVTPISVPKQWVEVFRFSGSGSKNSAVFSLGSGKARAKYDFQGGQYGGMFAYYIMPEGVDLMKQGGIPEVMLQQSEAGESYITKGSGNYYINASSANGKWSIVIEEER